MSSIDDKFIQFLKRKIGFYHKGYSPSLEELEDPKKFNKTETYMVITTFSTSVMKKDLLEVLVSEEMTAMLRLNGFEFSHIKLTEPIVVKIQYSGDKYKLRHATQHPRFYLKRLPTKAEPVDL